MKRTGRTWPTFAADLVRARAALRLGDEVGLAIRADRCRLGLSQRAYASERGLTEAAVIRLESAADSMKLGDIVAALSGTAFMLCLCHRPLEALPDAVALAAHGPGPDAPAPTGTDAGHDGWRTPSQALAGPADPPEPAAPPDWYAPRYSQRRQSAS
ncbi:MAG TPA: hypothetical protein VLQ78_07325 [Ornithinibacter sp.]|nr:hypothetical protein [Ornithinibacter sp.]